MNLARWKPFFSAIIFLLLVSCQKELPKNEIVLSSTCPPGFELTEDGTCELRSLYQQYSSLGDNGVGGLKTALPKVRDGFTPQQIDLGRHLFFDPILSGDATVSCATCHNPEKGLADGLDRSIGITGTPVARSAPSLWNVAFLRSFFWDGRATTLEQQMEGPLYSEDEMGTSPTKLLQTLNEIPAYSNMFQQAFTKRAETKIQLNEVYTALAAFECSLISLNSRYDQYAHGYHAALTKNEIEGLNVFRSFVARCAECHTPPLFTNQQIAVLGIPKKANRPLDPGAEIPFGDASMRGGFKVPSLRNVELTAPYMHAGQFATLHETVAFYTQGRGHAVPENEELFIHWHIWEPELTDTELDRLVDFLKTLTDESFAPKRPKVLPSSLENN